MRGRRLFLTAVAAAAAVGMAVGGGERGAAPHHLAHDPVIFGGEVVEAGDVAPRHHEHVRRRLRVDVLERDHAVVLIHDRARDLPRDDLAEQAIGHGTSLRARQPAGSRRYADITATRGMP